MSAKVFGSGIRRREDPRLITGTATYTEDVVLPDMAYMALLRSPHAQPQQHATEHARFGNMEQVHPEIERTLDSLVV